MRRLTDDGGNVIVITALLATTLMGFAALTIDVGSLLVRRSSLQTGADAAALAIAQRCAEMVVDTNTACTPASVGGLAGQYLDDNRLDGNSVTPLMDLRTSYAGRAGRVTVRGRANQQPRFAGAIGRTGDQAVEATATARWGPLTAEDAVFPLAICKGALPEIGEFFTLKVDPADPTAHAGDCDGAPDTPSFGWITPDDTTLCTSKITLLPSTYLDVRPSNAWPTDAGCVNPVDEGALDDVHNDVDATGVCHEHPSGNRPDAHCHGSADSDDRQRDVVVYDASAGSTGARPSYALVSIEFTGSRFAGREEVVTGGGGWFDAECSPLDPASIDDLQCIQGIVRASIPETDGPIVDPALAALPGIEDTTVLDVRLVD